MKKLFVAAALFTCAGVPAFAQNVANNRLAAGNYDWSGFYVGLNGGYGFAGTADKLVGYSPNQVGALVDGVYPSSFGLQGAGGLGGAQLGFNWKYQRAVWGIETDIQGADIRDGRVAAFPGNGNFLATTSAATSRVSWFGTTRVRTGWTVQPDILIYATAGAAYGSAQSSASTVGAAAAYFGDKSDSKIGYALGAGAEWMINRAWSIRGEYLFVDLGATTVRSLDTTLNPGSYVDYRINHEIHALRAAVNYRF